MPDYSKGKVYVIRAPGTDDIYVGSTTKALSARMANHRAHYRDWAINGGTWNSSYTILGHEGAYIELIEEFPCESKEQLNRREGEILRTLTGCVNEKVAGRTPKESHKAWADANREHLEAYNKEYLQANRNKINARRRERYAKKKSEQE